MKRWAWVVALLYGLILAALTVPAGMAAFTGKNAPDKVWEVYSEMPYWLWLGIVVLAQVTLLAVPVRVASRRPMTRAPLVGTVMAGGLMFAGLVAGAFYSLYEFAFSDKGDFSKATGIAVGLMLATWVGWAWVFFRMSRPPHPLEADLVTRQCRWLFRGSILELLVAVPTHIVARYRDYCCAGVMTFIGLTMGVSVMLFSFGPAVFFLFAERWRRLHPLQPTMAPDAPREPDWQSRN